MSLITEQYLVRMQDVTTEFPEYRTDIVDLDPHIDRRGAHAEVYMNYEVTGAPVGVTKRGVSVFRFRVSGGKEDAERMWKCYTFQIAEGIDGGMAG